MLVLDPTLELTAAEAALPANTPLILWENLATFGTVTATSENEDYPASNMTSPATNQEWRAADGGSPSGGPGQAEEISILLAASDEVDAVGVARHNFGTAGIIVELGYYDNSSPAEWVSLCGPRLAEDDAPILFWFTAQSFDGDLVLRLSAGSEVATAAVLYCGKLLVMERGVDVTADHKVPKFARRTEFSAGRSEAGDYLGRIVTTQFIQGVEHSYSHLTPGWYRAYADPFVFAAQQDVPFFYCFDRQENPDEVSFCWFADDPVPMTNPVTRLKKMVLKMDGIVE